MVLRFQVVTLEPEKWSIRLYLSRLPPPHHLRVAKARLARMIHVGGILGIDEHGRIRVAEAFVAPQDGGLPLVAREPWPRH